ncbi:ABC transporter permease [Bradyrhizobium jicamae]|uniref:ABC transporter permease n=1 Tax=Bradyrhizobium jicamae TaxID=280332 RepID=UPI001BABAE28|nr:ABC transporter permease [Bradyrhizobium jicamae]MBR0938027.1 ABC transporter permease [Bradyrhizobium jicamae]
MEYESELDIQSHRLGFAGALSPRSFLQDLIAGMRLLLRSRKLAVAMASRELRMRHAGQFAGALWIVGHPLFQMMVFVFIFGVVFSQRIGGTFEMPRDYTTYILSGLIPWLTFSTALPSLCASVVSNSNLVKQFTFQTEVLPIKDVLISLVFWIVGIAIITIYGIAVNRSLPWTYVLLPAVLALNILFTIGLGWILSAIGVFIRDMKDIAVVLVTAGIYVLPVVYLPSWVPTLFRPFVNFNPLSAFIWVYQDTLYFGRIEHPYAWVVFAAMSFACFSLGYRLFQILKPFFGKVL